MLVLITGGSKNGKSSLAEKIIAAFDAPKLYIATMEPFGEDAMAAIARHRRSRANGGYTTVEKYTDVGEIEAPPGGAMLIECLCNLCANEMFSAHIEDPARKIVNEVCSLADKAKILVAVTNQVGADGVDYDPDTMRYIRVLGEINRELAKRADCVIEAVFGIPVFLKGEPPCQF